MKVSFNLIVMGVLAALIVGGAYAVTLALARSGGNSALQQATTGTPGTMTATTQATATHPGTPVPVSLVRVWSQMCVEGVPYTLLSVPTDAKFAPVLPEQSPSLTTTPPAASGTGTPQASIGTASPQGGAGTTTMPGELACNGLGTINGQQLVMCTGPQASTFTLYVHNSSGTQQYHGDLWDCGANKHTTGAGAGLAPTAAPGTGTAPAATMPAPTQPPATQPAPTGTP